MGKGDLEVCHHVLGHNKLGLKHYTTELCSGKCRNGKGSRLAQQSATARIR
ncbi:hypothetical protein VCR12J2_640206 [Vibrio coralliirubri]|nr:hypothetical protein VCR12J2_640206 [Vibrio coralliirubri]